ncbi:MAG: hypothetical protein KC464_20995, partial [Myxococcales bacterium]|nr:hypothetical protein [Myxococcales bacterium]
ADPAAPAPKPASFTLARRTFAPGDEIAIAFAAPVPSAGSNRAWVAVSVAGSSATSYGTWTYVSDGATRAKLTAPADEGRYEVRLYTDYPRAGYHVAHTVDVTIAAAEAPPATADADAETPASLQRFTIADRTVHGGDKIELRFAAPLVAAKGERFWATIVAAGQPDSSWGSWSYVAAAARTVTLTAPATAGAYELRLHAHYPRKTSDVVHRETIQVE